MTLLSVLNIMLYRLTGARDICVGTVVASRNHEELETMIGPFINTIILRTRLAGDPTLRVVLQRVRDTMLEAYENQDLPFETLLQALERERTVTRNSLARVLVLFENSPAAPMSMGDLTVQVLDLGKGLLELNAELHTVTTFDLILTLRDRPEGVTGSLIYKRALFSPATIEGMIAAFAGTAELVASRPDGNLSLLPPLTHS